MADSDQPHVDSQSLSDVDLYVYETIATLEYLARPTTRAEIAAASQLTERAVGDMLESLTHRGLLVRSESGPVSEPVFEPARRGWSTAPGQSAGPQRR
jgi:hypothetical protein